MLFWVNRWGQSEHWNRFPGVCPLVGDDGALVGEPLGAERAREQLLSRVCALVGGDRAFLGEPLRAYGALERLHSGVRPLVSGGVARRVEVFPNQRHGLGSSPLPV